MNYGKRNLSRRKKSISSKKRMKKTGYRLPFVYGVQYYRAPIPHRDCWRRDLEKIRELGFDTVKFWVQWRWSERREGEYYWEDLDELMRLAEDNHLRVVLNLILDVMPGWVERDYPESLMVDRFGRTVVTRQVRVEMEAQNAQNYAVEPETLELLVEVPEALAKNSSYLRKLGVIVVPPPMEVGQSRQVDPRIRLPEGMTLLNPSLNPVTISRKK